MTLYVDDNTNAWRKDLIPSVNDSGAWKEIKRAWVNDGGVWKQFYGPIPTVNGRVLLMHFDGDQDSTTFIDDGNLHLPWLSYGAYIDTTTKKFGTGAGLFNGVNGIIVDPMQYGSHFYMEGDFTVDFWSTCDIVSPAFNIFMVSSTDVSSKLLFYLAPEGAMGMFDDWVYGSQPPTTLEFPWDSGVSPWNASGEWNHIAIVRKDFVVTLYINGTSVGSQEYSYTIGSNVYDWLGIGTYGAHGCYGSIDELRILSGVAAWTTDFPTPTGPYI